MRVPKKKKEVTFETPSVVHYVDFVSVSAGYLGVQIAFGTADQGGARISTAVGMSPEQAQSLHKVLGAMLENCKSKYGLIRPEPPILDGGNVISQDS